MPAPPSVTRATSKSVSLLGDESGERIDSHPETSHIRSTQVDGGEALSGSKRHWEGGDVRAYPQAKDPYKKTVKDQHPAKELPDDFSHSACELQSEKEDLEAEKVRESSAPGDTALDRFSVCIVGAGAIGCHLAYTLHRGGADVSLIARGRNLEALKAYGLRVTIAGEEKEPVHIRATDNPAEVGNVDYVFLTMKVSGYDSSIVDTISPLIGANSTILPPTTSIPYWWFYNYHSTGSLCGSRLHDVDPDGKLWACLPPCQVIGFTMWLSVVQPEPGCTVLRHVQRGYPLGELDGSKSWRVQRLAMALERGGVPAPQVSDIRAEIFIKSINSLAFNVVAVLGDAENGTIADVPEAVETLQTMMEECESIAGKLSLPLMQTAEERIKQTLSARMHTMSMLHDLRKGKKLELRPLWQSIQNLATDVGVKLPATRAIVGCALLREEAALRKLQTTAEVSESSLPFRGQKMQDSPDTA